MRVLFRLDEKHIHEGYAGSVYSCPVAKCIREQWPFKKPLSFQVCAKAVLLEAVDMGSNPVKLFDLPHDVIDFIHYFDNDMKHRCKPMEFEVDVAEIQFL